MSFHNPEREPNESFEQYKARRKLAARLVTIAKTGQATKYQQKLYNKYLKGEIK